MEFQEYEEALLKFKASEENLKKLNSILLNLAKSKAIDSGDFRTAIREITEAATLALGCERSSVWLYNEEKDAIVLSDLFQRSENLHSEGMSLYSKDFPAYFQYLQEERSLPAHDARTNPSTYEFSEIYLKPLNIFSMLDAPIRYSGEMVGVLCNENIGDFKKWTIEEEHFAGSLADLIGRAIESQKRKEAQDQLQVINRNLEKLVIERTKELQDTLQEVSHLKQLQDGDYYLIHLVEAPLGANRNRSRIVTTEFYLEQKKKVLFRDKLISVGGDISISGNIYFGDYSNRYIAFINADAMGKSMQGAGGAIVLGTAFNYILQKSAAAGKVVKDVSPKQWISNTYHELNSVFQTFDGTMMTSCIIGLIQESTGNALFVNAEHPFPVLYRDKVSSFIYNKTYVPKLGTQSKITLEILSIQLQPGDILFFGSDGKDDLKVSKETGEVEYLEDDNFFLDVVKKTDGNIQLILQEISKKGEITDDISLLKLSYRSDKKVEVDREKNEYNVYNLEDVKKMVIAKEFDRAFYFLLYLSQENPENSSIWNLLGICFYKQKKYENAEMAFNRAMQLKPNNKNIYKNQEKLLSKMQKLGLR